jgi:hypothetical protein
LNGGGAAERIVIKALPMLVPESVLQRSAEKKRIKEGILGESDEQRVFEKTLYLPYLDFTFQYSAERGFLSKRTVLARGGSIVLALREVDLDFCPELVSLKPLMVDIRSESDSVVQGVGSTVLISERLEELKRMLFDYDNQLEGLSKQYSSLLEADPVREGIKENIDHLKSTRETRWKMFADGLKLPSKIDLENLELLEGSLFYMPYFIVKFLRGGESRFLVWDREGKENDAIAEELMKNGKFRDIVQSHITGLEKDWIGESVTSDSGDPRLSGSGHVGGIVRRVPGLRKLLSLEKKKTENGSNHEVT